MWQASILVRAVVHGWRHMGGAHMRVEHVGAALAIGLDSSGSPGALSVPCAHSSHPAAFVGPPRCSELYALWNLAVAAADHRELAYRSGAVVVPAVSYRLEAHGLTTARLYKAQSIYIAPPKVKSKNLVRWTPPTCAPWPV